MKTAFGALSLIIFLSLSTTSMAQTRRRGSTTRKAPVATATPKPEPTAQPTAAPSTPVAPPRRPAGPVNVVMLNGQTLGTADFEPAVRQQLEQVEDKIAAAKREVLDLQINTILLQVEANRRRIDTHRLYEQKSLNAFLFPRLRKSKIARPARRTIGRHRSCFRESTSRCVPASRIRVETRRRSGEPSAQDDSGCDGRRYQLANLNNEAVVATIGGQPLKAGVLNERLKPIVYQIRLDAYEITRQQAEQLLSNLLLLEEARRRQIGPEEIIRTRSAIKFARQRKQTWQSFYEENKSRINGDLNGVRNQIASYLQERERQRLEEDLSARLRKNANIRWLITEPPPPVQNISVDDDPSRGPANAPVTIVEFTDFSVPHAPHASGY